MSYKENLYKNALKAVNQIYHESKYDADTDLYRSFDIINSVNDNQVASKEWLVEKLLPHIINHDIKKICILGGWYGITALMLSEYLPDVIIDTVDYDPLAKRFGKQLVDKDNIKFITDDGADWFFEHRGDYQLIINTSCEHMEPDDIALMCTLKREDAIVCFQGNNYHSVQSHINTSDSLDEFVESLHLKKIIEKEELRSPSGEYDRYMVIGK
tara:strand:- start:507 stop:1145 length:639 start_codon:yes stop_codon:yes gene_type:complete